MVRDPDYRQILIWAKALGIEAEVFISRIKENFERYQQYLDEQEKNDTVDEDDVEETPQIPSQFTLRSALR